MTKRRPLPETRLLMVLQIACAGSAIASLPAGDDRIHPVWLAAFIVPAILFSGLGIAPVRQVVPTWLRLTSAVALQGLAAWLAYVYFGELTGKSSLACSLLPALTYFTLRREPSDTSLSLFLSFCFLLIGIMLNNESADWTLLVFLVACPWAMQIEASNRGLLQRHAARGRAMSAGTRLLRRAQVVIALMLVALGAYFAVGLLPSPGQEHGGTSRRAATSGGQRTVGLSSEFDLRSGQGSPLNLSADQVLNVFAHRGGRVPGDLYLRMAFVDRPGSQKWTVWPFNTITRNQPPDRYFFCRDRIPGRLAPELSLTIRRLIPAVKGELFLPPGTIGFRGVPKIEFNRSRGYYRSRGLESSYRVAYQQLRWAAASDEVIDRGSAVARLDRLPKSLRTPRLRRLAQEFGAPREPRDRAASGLSPVQLAQRISRRLQGLCTYVLKDPEGPYTDAVHNFLFGNNRGFCMHFASSLAIMLRLHGIPCRIAMGLHGGQSNPDNSRTFGSQHAHAWVELPLANYGWVVVDPTPAARAGQRGWPRPDTTNPKDTAANRSIGVDGVHSGCFLGGWLPFLNDPLAVLSDPLEHPGTFLFLLGVFVVVTLCLVLLFARRTRKQRRTSGEVKPTPDALRARQILENILTALARHGHPKNHRATLEQFAAVLRDLDTELDLAILRRAFESYQQVRFGRKGLAGQRHDRLVAALVAVRALPS